MKELTLNVHKRSAKGGAASRRYRSQGYIPSVFYGRGQETLPGLLLYKEFQHLAQQAKISQVFFLKSEEEALNGRSGIVKEVQQDYVSGRVLHVDLQVLHEHEEIHVKISLKIQGEAPGVKLEGGILSVVSHELPVACLPKNIPQLINVDISELALGQSIHARDLKLPEGVRLYGNPEETIVSVVAVRTTKVDEEQAVAETVAAAETAEGEKDKADKGKEED